MITAEHLRERLSYEPDTGEWFWIYSRRDGFSGKPAGWIDAYGYKRIKIDGQTYIAARLAFLFVTGEWPKDEVDHIDGDPGNDCWDNLREATRTQNVQNRRIFSNNSSGIKGVFWNAERSKWCAQIDKRYLGLFETIEEARAAREKAEAELHGDFTRKDIA